MKKKSDETAQAQASSDQSSQGADEECSWFGGDVDREFIKMLVRLREEGKLDPDRQ